MGISSNDKITGSTADENDVGSLTETAPATDTASSGLNGRLQRIAQRLTSLIALFPAAFTSGGGIKAGLVDAIPAGANVIGQVIVDSGFVTASGSLIKVETEYTRVADTNAYAIGDVVSNDVTTTAPISLANCFRVVGGSGYVTKIKLITNKKSIVPRFRIHFFNVSTATLAGDNLPYKELYADTSKRVGYWDMPAMITAADSTNSDISRTIDMSVRMAVNADPAGQGLYAVLETLDAFTPASGQKFILSITVDNN